ncbi:MULTISPECIES: hypothetical protein [unclassified Sphingomonas]|jgi:hypothetical protein|uniref:hypothetical protein n=1 Tax=unclassified Sphingomonas TaxID=196159 RepID=UPI0018E55A2A|nr:MULTISPECIES: hypothetical protein [unclassified Sphingomonas]
MGLNDLLHRHQVSLMMADAATCREARHSHRALARAYAHRIDACVAPLRGDAAPLVSLA